MRDDPADDAQRHPEPPPTVTVGRPGHLVERAGGRFQSQLLPNAVAAPPALPPPVRPRPALPPATQLEPVAATANAASTLAVVEPIEIETLTRAGVAVIGTDRSRVMEEWRVIASRLLRNQPATRAAGRMDNALMVTSSLAREGKSFCAINLAITMAKNLGMATVLVDLDAKPNALTRLLGLSEHPGLLDLVEDPALPLAGLVVPTALPNLHFLPLGTRMAQLTRGSDAGITHSVMAVLEQVAHRLADCLLVLDTAPSLATGDAASLAPLVGQIAMVVEAEATQKSDVEAALGLLAPCSAISLILNKARSQRTGHFGVEYYG